MGVLQHLLLGCVAVLPTTSLYILPPINGTTKNTTCPIRVKEECLSTVKHPDSILKQDGCTIVAAVDCDVALEMPKYCPDPKLVKQALAWNPPQGCQPAWNKCISEINIPYFNRAVCGQYLPVLCHGSIDNDESQKITHAMDVLSRDFKDTMDFFYDHVPASKAQQFDLCIEHKPRGTPHHDLPRFHGHPVKGFPMSDDHAAPDADLFFKCLDEVKNSTFSEETISSLGPMA